MLALRRVVSFSLPWGLLTVIPLCELVEAYVIPKVDDVKVERLICRVCLQKNPFLSYLESEAPTDAISSDESCKVIAKPPSGKLEVSMFV